MIFLDSRYVDGRIFKTYNQLKDQYDLTVLRKFPEISSGIFFYEWVETDRIDAVANRFFGDSTYWWRIMDFNPEVSNPFEIEPGTLIRIPNAS